MTRVSTFSPRSKTDPQIAGLLVAAIGFLPFAGCGAAPGGGGASASRETASLSGSYTADDLTLVFLDNVGTSIILERATLFDLALEAGLLAVEAPAGPGSKRATHARSTLNGHPLLDGPQSLPLGTPRWVTDLQAREGVGALYATLQSLAFDAETQAIRLTVRLETTQRDTGGTTQQTVNQLLPEAAYWSRSWFGVSITADGNLRVEWSEGSWTDPDGNVHTTAGGAAEFEGLRGDDADTSGIWAFSSILSADADNQWVFGDPLLGFRTYDWSARPPTMYFESPFCVFFCAPYQELIDPADYLEAQERITALPLDQRVDLSPYFADRDEEYYTLFTLHELSLTQSANLYRVRASATYYQSGPAADVSQAQRTTYVFADGVLIERPIDFEAALRAAGEVCPTAEQPLGLPKIVQRRLIFSTLEQHTQVYLDTNTTVVDEGDPTASIQLVGPWVNPRLDVQITEPGPHRATVGERFTLHAISDSRANVVWMIASTGGPLCESLKELTWTGPELAFTWNDRNSGLSATVVVFAWMGRGPSEPAAIGWAVAPLEINLGSEVGEGDDCGNDCDDGWFCTGSETCFDGVCVSSGDPCTGVGPCIEERDTCGECYRDSECDDGAYCNGAEVCSSGLCVAGTAFCGEQQVCDEDADACNAACNDAGDCNDGDPCTTDSCVNGVCQSTTGMCDAVPACIDDSECDDGLFCNGVESCDVAIGNCVQGIRPCNDNEGMGCEDLAGIATEACVEGDFGPVCSGCP